MIRLLFTALLAITSLLPLPALASFPATSDPTVCTVAPCYTYTVGDYNGNQTSPRKSTPGATCPLALPSFPPSLGATAVLTGTNNASYVCNFKDYTGGAIVSRAVQYETAAPSSPVYSCPSNATLSGSTCTCSAGFNQVGSTCVAKAVCDWAKGMQVAGGSFMIETGKNFCHSGCTFTLAPDAGSSPFRAKQDGKWYEQRYQGDFIGTGTGAANCGVGDAEEEATVEPPADKPEVPSQPCPPGQTAGAQIIGPGGGGYVCNTPEESESLKKKTVETVNPDGSTSSTETQTTTVCGANSCNTTTTTSTTSGGTTETKSESATQGKDDFCRSNPADKNCTGSGNAGTGTAGGDQSSPDHPKLWEKKYPDGLSGVWSSKKADLLNTEIGRLVPKLMPDNIPNAGSVPVWNISLDVGIADFGVHDVAPSAEVWGWAKVFVILSALLLARALIFGG